MNFTKKSIIAILVFITSHSIFAENLGEQPTFCSLNPKGKACEAYLNQRLFKFKNLNLHDRSISQNAPFTGVYVKKMYDLTPQLKQELVNAMEELKADGEAGNLNALYQYGNFLTFARHDAIVSKFNPTEENIKRILLKAAKMGHYGASFSISQATEFWHGATEDAYAWSIIAQAQGTFLPMALLYCRRPEYKCTQQFLDNAFLLAEGIVLQNDFKVSEIQQSKVR